MNKKFDSYEIVAKNLTTNEEFILGSVVTDNPNEIVIKGLGNNWAAVYEELCNFIKNHEFRKLTLKIIFYMITHMTWGNRVFKSQREIAKYFNVSEALVSVSIKELKNCDFCIKDNNSNEKNLFLINPEFSHKGKQRKQTYRVYDKFVESNFNKKKSAENNSTQDTNHFNYKVDESISKEFLSFNKNKAIKMLEFFIQHFEKISIIEKTLDEISEITDVSKVTLIKFVKLLEKHKFITRRRKRILSISAVQKFNSLLYQIANPHCNNMS